MHAGSKPRDPKRRLLITGMARSGTTLLDRLLTSHPDVDIVSQPFPLLFVQAKLDFLAGRGQQKYFALNDDAIQRDWDEPEWAVFLSRWKISGPELHRIFDRMLGYSGRMTLPEEPLPEPAPEMVGFNDTLEHCLAAYRPKPGQYLGFKEIMVEEFLSYLGNCGYRCIVIVRDPRDVVASANYPRKTKYLGEKKPTLFLLRSWRKSVEYCHRLRNEPWFRFLRYEDLVARPYDEMNRLCEFIEVADFNESIERGVIRDRAGEIWRANTSRSQPSSTISTASIGTYREKLTRQEVRYIETICCHEMRWLGYRIGTLTRAAEIIQSFRDFDLESQHEVGADYSSQPENVAAELRRQQDYRNYYSP